MSDVQENDAPEAPIDLLLGFEQESSADVADNIVLFYVTEGAVGHLPAWWPEFERRKDLATVLNCPVYEVFQFSDPPTKAESAIWEDVALFVLDIKRTLQQYTPELRANLKAQVAEQVRAAVGQAVGGLVETIGQNGSQHE